ncbi:cell division protein FtsX [Loktanella agnita]|uniref:cell division protein FtsX n=1 Tax=Loktanella agnita TaxID=287097 RepID=UPI00398584EB
MKALFELIVGDPQADRAVPRSGITSRLTVFVATTMAFLAVLALALSTTAGRVADRWADELAQAATLRLPADPDQSEALLRLALQILETTPGVASARTLSNAEQQALLEPWFGPDLPLETLNVPQLVEVIAEDDGYDLAGLSARLSAEIPGAVLDDHGAWREPLIAAAGRIRLIGCAIALMIGATVAAMVTLAAQASLSANAQVIRVLRLVGARDVYIARAFVRRFTLRSAAGAMLGTILAVLILFVLPQGEGVGPFTNIGFTGTGWLWPVLMPVLIACIAFFATRAAALRRLREQT